MKRRGTKEKDHNVEKIIKVNDEIEVNISTNPNLSSPSDQETKCKEYSFKNKIEKYSINMSEVLSHETKKMTPCSTLIKKEPDLHSLPSSDIKRESSLIPSPKVMVNQDNSLSFNSPLAETFGKSPVKTNYPSAHPFFPHLLPQPELPVHPELLTPKTELFEAEMAPSVGSSQPFPDSNAFSFISQIPEETLSTKVKLEGGKNSFLSKQNINRKKKTEKELLYDALHEIKWAQHFTPSYILSKKNTRRSKKRNIDYYLIAKGKLKNDNKGNSSQNKMTLKAKLSLAKKIKLSKKYCPSKKKEIKHSTFLKSEKNTKQKTLSANMKFVSNSPQITTRKIKKETTHEHQHTFKTKKMISKLNSENSMQGHLNKIKKEADVPLACFVICDKANSLKKNVPYTKKSVIKNPLLNHVKADSSRVKQIVNKSRDEVMTNNELRCPKWKCELKDKLAIKTPKVETLIQGDKMLWKTNSEAPKPGKKKKIEEECPESLRISVRQSECAFRYKEIAVRKHQNYLQIVLVPNTSRLNSLTPDGLKELREALHTALKDPGCRAVLLNSSGSIFCSGLDLNLLISSNRKKAALDMALALKELVQVLSKFPKPLIAAVNGAAVGFGVTLLTYCDVVLASDKATFATPYSRLGYIPEGGATLTLPPVIGSTLASAMLLDGLQLTAQQALQYGLVSEVLWPSCLMEEVQPRIVQIASQPLQVMEATKIMVRCHLWERFQSTLDYEVSLLPQQWLSPYCQQSMRHALAHRMFLLD